MMPLPNKVLHADEVGKLYAEGASEEEKTEST